MNFDLSKVTQDATAKTQETVSASVQDALMKMIEPLMPFIIIMGVLVMLGVVVWIFSLIQQMRANSAVISMRKILLEMNERDKQRHAPASSAPAVVRDVV